MTLMLKKCINNFCVESATQIDLCFSTIRASRDKTPQEIK